MKRLGFYRLDGCLNLYPGAERIRPISAQLAGVPGQAPKKADSGAKSKARPKR